RVTDTFNHTASATRTFTIDRTPPAIKIVSPVAGAVSSTNTIDVTGTAGDAVSVTVNGIAAQLAGGTFTAHAIPLDLAENPPTAPGLAAAGNTGADQVLVTLAGSGPGLVITSPPDQYLTNRPRVDVAGRVIAQTADGTVTVGSQSVTVDSTGV